MTGEKERQNLIYHLPFRQVAIGPRVVILANHQTQDIIALAEMGLLVTH